MVEPGSMSRGEMIRRLDSASKQVKDRLGNGPLTLQERRALEATLLRLLPLVADSLQEQEDREAAEALTRSFASPDTEGL